MQFSNFITVLAMAMTATALPAPAEEINNSELVARSGGNGNIYQGNCSNNAKQTCCMKASNAAGLLTILGGLVNVKTDDLLCSVNVLGGPCNAESYCCTTNASGVSFCFSL